MTKRSPYVDYEQLERQERLLEENVQLEIIRESVAEDVTSELLGDQDKNQIVNIERQKLVEFMKQAIMIYEKRRMAHNFGLE